MSGGMDKAEQESREEDNSFQEKNEFTDVSLVVEGRKLHVHKSILARNSSVFHRMFLSDFQERTASDIELPGKTYDLTVKFLQQIYPVHTLDQISDDLMPALLAIADEYQAKQVIANCEVHIGDRLVPFKVKRPVYAKNSEQLKEHALYVDKLLLYLWMCEQYGMKRYRAFLIERCALEEIRHLERSKFYKRVPATAVAAFLNIRCKELEKYSKECQGVIERLENTAKKCFFEKKHHESVLM